MRTVKLLHLYSQSMDLYGDPSNIEIVRQRVEQMGYPCQLDRLELGDEIDTTGYDLVYLGHGKGRNLAAIAPHFRKYGDHIRAQIEAGQLWLATGSSRLLFGKSFETWDGGEEAGIGLFDYTAAETKNVIVSDVVGSPVFDESLRCYGFINRTEEIIGGGKNPLFRLECGMGDGKEPARTEGDLYRNYFGTWQMGPLLCRNPGLLRELLHRMLGADCPIPDDSLEQEALRRVLAEFDARK